MNLRNIARATALPAAWLALFAAAWIAITAASAALIGLAKP
jgi:hypothetical protein